MKIPQQLMNEDFRFVLIRPKTKKPFEYNWQVLNNYPYNKIPDFSGNLGVVCGLGNLIVLDIDDEKFLERFDKLETFSIETGSLKRHYYFICGEKFARNYYVLGKGAGELRVSKSQVIIPPSIHPNGNEYKVFKDLPIMNITKKQLKEVLGDLMNKEESVISDLSRSGQDWKDVCECISSGYNFDDTNKELMLIGSDRWKSDVMGYKIGTYCNALKNIKCKEVKK